jgi:hypothetical protein
MSSCARAAGSINGKITFGALAQQVLSLDAAIEWVALEEAGREPHWAWRDPRTGSMRAGTTANSAQLVDPLLLMIAESSDDLYGGETAANPHRLLFVVLAYGDFAQIVARLGRDAHLSVAVSPGINAYVLGRKLTTLLNRCTQGPVMH